MPAGAPPPRLQNDGRVGSNATSNTKSYYRGGLTVCHMGLSLTYHGRVARQSGARSTTGTCRPVHGPAPIGMHDDQGGQQRHQKRWRSDLHTQGPDCKLMLDCLWSPSYPAIIDRRYSGGEIQQLQGVASEVWRPAGPRTRAVMAQMPPQSVTWWMRPPLAGD